MIEESSVYGYCAIMVMLASAAVLIGFLWYKSKNK